MSEEINAILDFWFSELSPKDWFMADKERQKWIDDEVRSRFHAEYEAALAGAHNEWMESPKGCLALCLLLDQFPRHMFRGTPKAFASDFFALSVSKLAIENDFDLKLGDNERAFLYLPFEHSEKIEDQAQSVECFYALQNEVYLDYALKHMRDIVRFGRFPHRNKILGRISTPAELDYLNQGGGF